MKRFIIIIMLAGMTLVSGCNTVGGMVGGLGKDLRQLGDSIGTS